MKPGDIVFHKATAEPMVVLHDLVRDDSTESMTVLVRRMGLHAHGEQQYHEDEFLKTEFETFEERATRERDMQKFLFSLSNPPKGPQQIN